MIIRRNVLYVSYNGTICLGTTLNAINFWAVHSLSAQTPNWGGKELVAHTIKHLLRKRGRLIDTV